MRRAKVYKNFINGRWVKPHSGKTFKDINPANTDEVVGVFQRSDDRDVNDAETHLPFGGTKHTGNGHREACTQSLNVFSEWKSIYVDFPGVIQRAQIDNR